MSLYTKNIKQEINIGHSNNKNFVQIPFWQLRQKLKALCFRYGIDYLEQQQSYSSKVSFYDRDKYLLTMPITPVKLNFRVTE
ncbi:MULTISPECIES: hypothetical protein [Okeania]|uniref:hypothetical protein n=1 Tax=Okeania TaxID=1458928 RepID=UPI00195FBCC3|nr:MULTISPECIES: hypothetical protein [Okeania]